MYDMLTGLSKYQLGISTINTPNLSAMTTKSTETGKWSLNSSKTGEMAKLERTSTREIQTHHVAYSSQINRIM